MNVTSILTDRIQVDPHQPRQVIDPEAIKGLALSIRERGLLQPVIVYRDHDGFFLVDGHRRLEAIKLLKGQDIAAVVLEQKPDADQLLLTQLATTCHRSDLTPLELAQAYDRLLKLKQWSQAELAAALHISKAKVCQTLACLTLPDEAQQAVANGSLPLSTAYTIARVPDLATRCDLLQQARAGKLTRDAAQSALNRSIGKRGPCTRMVLQLRTATVNIAAGEQTTLADVSVMLAKLVKDCRQAAAEGLDIRTFERLLADRSRKESLAATE